MPETKQHIAEVMERLTEPEQFVVKWQFGMLGTFETALVNAITKADDNNLMALSLGFPMQVSAYRDFCHGNMAKGLRALGLDI